MRIEILSLVLYHKTTKTCIMNRLIMQSNFWRLIKISYYSYIIIDDYMSIIIMYMHAITNVILNYRTKIL